LYAATKQAFESLLKYYVDAFHFSAIWLTLSQVYGEHHARSTLMTDIAAAWTQRSPLTLLSPQARVDLVHVEDAARAFVQAAALLEGSAAQRRLSRYSVTSGQDTSATEVVRMFERLGSRRLIVKIGEPGRALRSMRPWRGNVMPGWVPRISLEEGIVRILEHANGLVDFRTSRSGGS
jgi:nucleoside-diphosphate-sugar epimerase